MKAMQMVSLFLIVGMTGCGQLQKLISKVDIPILVDVKTVTGTIKLQNMNDYTGVKVSTNGNSTYTDKCGKFLLPMTTIKTLSINVSNTSLIIEKQGYVTQNIIIPTVASENTYVINLTLSQSIINKQYDSQSITVNGIILLKNTQDWSNIKILFNDKTIITDIYGCFLLNVTPNTIIKIEKLGYEKKNLIINSDQQFIYEELSPSYCISVLNNEPTINITITVTLENQSDSFNDVKIFGDCGTVTKNSNGVFNITAPVNRQAMTIHITKPGYQENGIISIQNSNSVFLKKMPRLNVLCRKYENTLILSPNLEFGYRAYFVYAIDNKGNRIFVCQNYRGGDQNIDLTKWTYNKFLVKAIGYGDDQTEYSYSNIITIDNPYIAENINASDRMISSVNESINAPTAYIFYGHIPNIPYIYYGDTVFKQGIGIELIYPLENSPQIFTTCDNNGDFTLIVPKTVFWDNPQISTFRIKITEELGKQNKIHYFTYTLNNLSYITRIEL